MSNVTNLRKAGNLDAAYRLAKENLDRDPQDIWNRRDMAWVLYDYAKQKATVATKQRFLRCIDKMLENDMPSDEEIFHQSAAFLIRGMAATMIRAEQQDIQFFDSLFQYAQRLKTQPKTPAYSALMTVMLRTKNWWTGFRKFCEWWNFDSFMDEDYKSSSTSSDDQTKIMPLAERVLMAYCHCLLDSATPVEIADFLPWLDNFSAQHRNYVYLPFFSAKLLLRASRKDECLGKLKIFAKKKGGDFWVWDVIGDCYDDPQTRLNCYARGLICKSKPEMSIKLREKTAWLLRTLNHHPQAMAELLRVVEIRRKNNWSVGSALTSAIDTYRAQGITPTADNKDFFQQLAANTASIAPLIGGKNITKNKPQSLNFEGKITIAPQGFGFVRFDGKNIFVAANLIQSANIANHSTVSGKYISAFDKKKNKDGFRAVKIG